MDLKEFIKKHSCKYCTNRHLSDVLYMSPEMYELAKEAKECGEEYFYTKKVGEKLVMGEPEYMYRIEAELTPDEWVKLVNE